jgi:hypothetical protein
MNWFKSVTAVALSLVILFGCGKKEEAPAPAPTPAPVAPVQTPKVPGTNCDLLSGGTSLSSTPFVGRLTTNASNAYQWANQMSSITLSASVTSNVGYSYQVNNLIASGAISLAELSYAVQNNTTVPTACLTSPATSNQGSNSGTFYNGQVRNLVLTGTISVPFYSPFQPGTGYYNWNTPGTTSPTTGTQQVQVIVGSTCNTSFVPSYGSNSGRIRGCITVRVGSQTQIYYSE